jgi:hypothetical protein
MNTVTPPAGLEARAISVPEDVEEAFEFLYAQGMTDGLLVIPPTPERVGRMIASGPADQRADDIVVIVADGPELNHVGFLASFGNDLAIGKIGE